MVRKDATFILVSYDIPDDRRRVRLAKALCDYGERVQYSVFECTLSQAQITRLLREIRSIMEEDKDSVRVYRLCATCARQILALGQAKLLADEPEVYIV